MSGSGGAGINIGSIGGNASFTAGGDIVGGDKITTNNGFRQDDDKHRFLDAVS